MLNRTKLLQVLTRVFEHAMPDLEKYNYRLVGTAASILHGVDIPSSDIDILFKKREGVDYLAKALSSYECTTKPDWFPEYNQYFAVFNVDDVDVELSTVEVETTSDAVETYGDGPWKHYTLLPCGPFKVPIVNLELRLITDIFRRRPDRYKPLIHHLKERSCDIELVRRGLVRCNFQNDFIESITSQLSHGRAQ